MLEEAVKAVLQHSQQIPRVDGVGDLMKRWETAKNRYIEQWGGPIYKCPDYKTFTLDTKAKQDKVEEFLIKIENEIGFSSEFTDFIMDNGPDAFFNNITSCVFELKNGKTIPKGMKMGRAFKFFFQDEHALKLARSYQSYEIAKKEIKGYLYFSVHPLDFLSMSENNAGWKSCQSLKGEYRAAALSYMCDETTVVCYLAEDRKEKITNFPDEVPWNSKKWRVLLYNNDDTMAMGCHYPFYLSDIIEDVKNQFLYSMDKNTDRFTSWHKDHIGLRSYENGDGTFVPADGDILLVDGYATPAKEFAVNAPDSFHYNDIVSGSHHCNYAFKRLKKRHQLMLGSRCNCICCNSNNKIIDSDVMLCNNCDKEYNNTITCDCCGARIKIGDEFALTYLNEYVCEECFNEYCCVCDKCGEYYYIVDTENEICFNCKK